VETTIADALGVPHKSVRVDSGHTSARKVVEIAGLSQDEVHHRLSKTG
jgi:uncharacterized protein YggU (UPF0235/DUF167 family)